LKDKGGETKENMNRRKITEENKIRNEGEIIKEGGGSKIEI
jgi:hypothetical protein